MPITKIFRSFCCIQAAEEANVNLPIAASSIEEMVEVHHNPFEEIIEAHNPFSEEKEETKPLPEGATAQESEEPSEKDEEGEDVLGFMLGVDTGVEDHRVFDLTHIFDDLERTILKRDASTERKQDVALVEEDVAPAEEKSMFTHEEFKKLRSNSWPRVKTQKDRISKAIFMCNGSKTGDKKPRKINKQDKIVKINVFLPSAEASMRCVRMFASAAVKTTSDVSNFKEAARLFGLAAQESFQEAQEAVQANQEINGGAYAFPSLVENAGMTGGMAKELIRLIEETNSFAEAIKPRQAIVKQVHKAIVEQPREETRL